MSQGVFKCTALTVYTTIKISLGTKTQALLLLSFHFQRKKLKIQSRKGVQYVFLVEATQSVTL